MGSPIFTEKQKKAKSDSNRNGVEMGSPSNTEKRQKIQSDSNRNSVEMLFSKQR